MKLTTYFLLIVSLFPVALCHGVEETKLLGLLESDILTYYDSGTSQTFLGVDQKEVHFHALRRGHNKAIIILPGRTEPTKKYAELVYDLKDLPFDFFLLDPRGQGFSQRLLADPQKGYVENYQDYRKDLETFIDKEVNNYEKVFFVAHSMGAAIALRYSAHYPQKVAGLVTSSPMMEIKTNGLPESVAFVMAKGLKLIGKKRFYVPGGGRFEGQTPFSQNRVTQSKPRYAMARLIDREDPKLYMGSATNNWLLEAIKMGRKIARDAKKLKDIPILLFQAGQDEFSKDKRQQEFCEKLPKCTLKRFSDSKHEMFQETDKIRNVVLTMTKSFLQKY